MKTTVEVINVIASLVILLSSLYLLFIHYASHHSTLEKALHRYEFGLGKIALIIMSMGTLWAVVKIEELPISQVVLNVGLAAFLIWVAVKLNRHFYSNEKIE